MLTKTKKPKGSASVSEMKNKKNEQSDDDGGGGGDSSRKKNNSREIGLPITEFRKVGLFCR